jgi:hypothetical protein
MHNLHLEQDQQRLKDKMLELRRQLLLIDSTLSLQEIVEAAADFSSGPALQAYCSSLYSMMQEHAASGQRTDG